VSAKSPHVGLSRSQPARHTAPLVRYDSGRWPHSGELYLTLRDGRRIRVHADGQGGESAEVEPTDLRTHSNSSSEAPDERLTFVAQPGDRARFLAFDGRPTDLRLLDPSWLALHLPTPAPYGLIRHTTEVDALTCLLTLVDATGHSLAAT
jgi:hypothetical protein